MSTELDPKEIARIKKLARAARIRRIRRRAAVTAASLAAFFSAAILARTQLDPTSPAGSLQAAVVTRNAPEPATGITTTSGDDHGSDESGGHESDDHDDDHESDDHDDDRDGGRDGGFLDSMAGAVSDAFGALDTGTPGQNSPQATAPEPAPAPLTTSQS
jgi:hypothetical protein